MRPSVSEAAPGSAIALASVAAHAPAGSVSRYWPPHEQRGFPEREFPLGGTGRRPKGVEISSTQDLIAALKAELKSAQVTYADLADALGMSESSIKRMFAKADMPLSRIDDVLRVLKMDFADLARQVAEAQPLRHELTLEQERAVVADRKLLLMAICVLSQWSAEQIVASYQINEAECEVYLRLLDRLGVIELRDDSRNSRRYRPKLAKTFRWRPDGPVMRFFREQVIDDYFAGGFDGPGETLMLVHGQVAPAAARGFVERLQRIGQDLAQQHLADQRLDEGERQPVTLLVGMRAWWFAALRDLKREPGG